jgi:hypothetical protein
MSMATAWTAARCGSDNPDQKASRLLCSRFSATNNTRLRSKSLTKGEIAMPSRERLLIDADVPHRFGLVPGQSKAERPLLNAVHFVLAQTKLTGDRFLAGDLVPGRGTWLPQRHERL